MRYCFYCFINKISAHWNSDVWDQSLLFQNRMNTLFSKNCGIFCNATPHTIIFFFSIVWGVALQKILILISEIEKNKCSFYSWMVISYYKHFIPLKISELEWEKCGIYHFRSNSVILNEEKWLGYWHWPNTSKLIVKDGAHKTLILSDDNRSLHTTPYTTPQTTPH